MTFAHRLARFHGLLAPAAGLAFFVGAMNCGDDSSTTTTTTDAGTSSSADGGDVTTDAGTSTGDSGNTTSTACASEASGVAQAVCAANAFLATLSSAQKTTANPVFTDSAGRTKWSNLPTQMVARAGLKMGDLTSDQQTAALTMMSTVLTADGYADLTGIRAADDYLAANGGGGGYGSGLYFVAVFGTPGMTGSWEIAFGGHHLAFNITYVDGVAYPVPNHMGVEPKASFTQNGATYAPLDAEGSTLQGAFKALDSTTLASAYLSGQKFSDVLIGPVEYGSGSVSAVNAKYPSSATRGGVVVSTLPAATQALVTAAISQWVRDYVPETADALVAEYTSATAYADTVIAWGGTQASGVDVDVNGTYMRIDGPRVWIELACQGGIVIQGKTHYHTIYRDKAYDYGSTL